MPHQFSRDGARFFLLCRRILGYSFQEIGFSFVERGKVVTVVKSAVLIVIKVGCPLFAKLAEYGMQFENLVVSKIEGLHGLRVW